MTNGRIGPPWWSKVWIVAGGPSARNFDLSRAYGDVVLGVNDAALNARFWSHPGSAFATCDPDWIKKHRTLLKLFGGERFLAVALDTWPECGGIPGATYLTRENGDGLSEDFECVRTGGNSGYMALNVALHKGAKEIHLVGFDMDDGSEKYAQWIPRFRTTRQQLDAAGVKVINENPRSAVDAFEKTEVFA